MTALEDYVRLLVYAGTAVLLLRVIHLLVLVPVARGRELDRAQRRLLITAAKLGLVIFALAGGFSAAGDLLQVSALHSSAKDFLLMHQRWIVEAGVAVSAVQSAVSVVSLPPFSTAADALNWIRERLFSAGEMVSVLIAALEFGNRYAMSTFFPLGVLLLLLPGARSAGGFLIGAALWFWLILPAAVAVQLQLVAHFIGADSEPPLGILLALVPILGVFLGAAEVPALVAPLAAEQGQEFFDWSVRETALWLGIAPALLGFYALLTLAAAVYVAGGGRTVAILRRITRYLLPLRAP